MSITPADEPSSTQPNITLNEKQERVDVCLTACLKRPHRFNLELRAGGECRFVATFDIVATFDKTAAGVTFEDVESSQEHIRVAAKYDVASLEVDYETLAVSTGLESADEVEEIWESIKKLVQPAVLVPEHAILSGNKHGGVTIPTNT